MKISHSAAGRSRSVDARAFFSKSVARTTQFEAAPHPPSFPYGWKNAIKDRVWAKDGPRGNFARSVLEILIRHADANGRTWIGVHTIAERAGIGNERTVRTALETLAQDGWLHIASQTWATLTAEQKAAGRPLPRRTDVGQAPNLYQVLDGHGNAVTSEPSSRSSTTRPGLARVSSSPSADPKLDQTPRQICPGGHRQIDQGEPPADLPVDLDPVKSESRMESAEPAQDTHHVSKIHEKDERKRSAWALLVEAHAAKMKSTFGLAPSKPDLRLEDSERMSERLLEAADDVRTKLAQRYGIERDVAEIQRDLATRVMRFYFKHESEHLRRVRWALRDLTREIDARMIDAMQALLREARDSAPPQQVQLELPAVETTTRSAQVEKPKQPESQQPTPPAAARAEVQSIIAEFLNGSILQEQAPTPRWAETPSSPLPTRPALRDCFVDELQRQRANTEPSVTSSRRGMLQHAVVESKAGEVMANA